MIAFIVGVSAYWFFAVNTYETWFVPWGPTPNIERSTGGWTHDGPYKTHAACEKARHAIKREPYRSESHVLRFDPQPCRALTFEQYIRERR